MPGGGGWPEGASIFQSLPNTPPTFAAYILGLTLQDLEARGGLSAVEGDAEDDDSGVPFSTRMLLHGKNVGTLSGFMSMKYMSGLSPEEDEEESLPHTRER